MSDIASQAQITQIATVGILVADQDEALEFYVGKLGFEKRRDVPFGPATRWIEVAPAGAATTIALIAEGSGITPGVRLAAPDIDALHADLRARGADADEDILRMGFVPPMFTVRDGVGNQLAIVEIPEGG
jgi:catechol 2,3-dioxygenase-like lactoylglutathione lyase family enzyme